MDVFLEYLMRKEPTKQDGLKKTGLVFAAVIACLLVMIGFPLLGSFMNNLVLPGVAAVVYGMMVLLRNFNLEFEYIFTNGTLDVDVIKARTTRSRMTSLQCKNIEKMVSITDERYKNLFENDMISRRFDAVFDSQKGGIYQVLFTYDGEKMVLTFQPPVKLLGAMWQANPRCVELAQKDMEEWKAME